MVRNDGSEFLFLTYRFILTCVVPFQMVMSTRFLGFVVGANATMFRFCVGALFAVTSQYLRREYYCVEPTHVYGLQTRMIVSGFCFVAGSNHVCDVSSKFCSWCATCWVGVLRVVCEVRTRVDDETNESLPTLCQASWPMN